MEKKQKGRSYIVIGRIENHERKFMLDRHFSCIHKILVKLFLGIEIKD